MWSWHDLIASWGIYDLVIFTRIRIWCLQYNIISIVQWWLWDLVVVRTYDERLKGVSRGLNSYCLSVRVLGCICPYSYIIFYWELMVFSCIPLTIRCRNIVYIILLSKSNRKYELNIWKHLYSATFETESRTVGLHCILCINNNIRHEEGCVYY